ncbi:MAG: aminotransferase class V-fold PLP-dependent enzyme [Bacillota bacterium]
MIYLDNAATSWPKPPAVKRAVLEALDEAGNPGRSGHALALASARRVLAAREALAQLLGAPDPARIALTANATGALNLAITGLLRPGDRVVTTAVEHNSVMRPLRALQHQGVELEVVRCSPDGRVDPADVARALRKKTRLLVATHASNVLGAIQPVNELGRLAREAGTLFLVDASQTAGALEIDLASLPVDLLAFTGHKALLGPQGTGGLYLREGLELEPLTRGGTGSASELEEQPEFAPDRYESGTPNVPGLAGLAAAAEYLVAHGVAAVRTREVALTERFLAGLREIPGVVVYGPAEATARTGLVSLNLRGVSSSMLSQALEEGFGVLTRAGLHCAPAAHRTAGTYPDGSVRFSFGAASTSADVDGALEALRTLAAHL